MRQYELALAELADSLNPNREEETVITTKRETKKQRLEREMLESKTRWLSHAKGFTHLTITPEEAEHISKLPPEEQARERRRLAKERGRAPKRPA